MKRHRKLFAMIGIVAVCAFGLTLISGAQPNAQQNSRQMPGNRPNMPPQAQNGDQPNARQNFRQMPEDRMDMAQDRKGGVQNRRFDGNVGFGLNLAGVELSDEQQEQVRQLMRDFQVNTAEVRQQLLFAQQDLRKEMRSETSDQAEVDSLWTEIARLKQQLGQAQINHLLALKGVLTPEQLATIQENERAELELQKLRLEQRELLLASGASNVQRLQEIQAEIAQQETALERERFENIAERLATMTPEEQEQLPNNRGQAKKAQRRQ